MRGEQPGLAWADLEVALMRGYYPLDLPGAGRHGLHHDQGRGLTLGALNAGPAPQRGDVRRLGQVHIQLHHVPRVHPGGGQHGGQVAEGEPGGAVNSSSGCPSTTTATCPETCSQRAPGAAAKPWP